MTISCKECGTCRLGFRASAISSLCSVQELQHQKAPAEQHAAETCLQSTGSCLCKTSSQTTSGGDAAAGKLPGSFIPKEEKLKPIQFRNLLL